MNIWTECHSEDHAAVNKRWTARFLGVLRKALLTMYLSAQPRPVGFYLLNQLQSDDHRRKTRMHSPRSYALDSMAQLGKFHPLH
jgi:hypothetical protein